MKRVISISLSLLILAGGLGITFGTHYCMGIPVKEAWMIGHDDLSCGMASVEESGNWDVTSFSKDCCQDDYLTLEGSELFKQITKIHIPCPDCLKFSTLYKIDVLANDENLNRDFYHPPPPDVDVTITQQVFRI